MQENDFESSTIILTQLYNEIIVRNLKILIRLACQHFNILSLRKQSMYFCFFKILFIENKSLRLRQEKSEVKCSDY